VGLVSKLPKEKTNLGCRKFPRSRQTDRERKFVELQRAFRLTGAPFILPPATPRDRGEILKEAFRKTYRDAEFYREHKNLTGEEPTQDPEKAMREILLG
jgi:hypothetical protein